MSYGIKLVHKKLIKALRYCKGGDLPEEWNQLLYLVGICFDLLYPEREWLLLERSNVNELHKMILSPEWCQRRLWQAKIGHKKLTAPVIVKGSWWPKKWLGAYSRPGFSCIYWLGES